MTKETKHLRYLNLPSKDAKQIKKEISRIVAEIRTRRVELNISQEKLAEILNMSVGMIKGIEQEVRTPSLTTLIRLVNSLNLKIELLNK